jgi:hypothetical protein
MAMSPGERAAREGHQKENSAGGNNNTGGGGGGNNNSNLTDQQFSDLTGPGTGIVGVNFNLDPNNPMSGLQLGGYAAPGSNPEAALAAAVSGLGQDNTGGFSIGGAFDALMGTSPTGTSVSTFSPSSLSLTDNSITNLAYDAAGTLSGTSIKEKTSLERIKDAFTNAGYNSFAANFTNAGLPAPSKEAYQAMNPGIGQGVADYFGGLGANLETAGKLSLDAANTMAVGYGGVMPSTVGAIGALIDQTPTNLAAMSTYNLTGIKPDLVDSLAMIDAYGNKVRSLSSRAKSAISDFTGYNELDIDDYKDLAEFEAAKLKQEMNALSGQSIDFDKAVAAGLKFNPGFEKKAGSLSPSDYATALANDMFADPELAAAYRTQAELDKINAKEAGKGNTMKSVSVGEEKDLSVLSENGLIIYNQLKDSGYETEYAYNHALGYE